MILFVYSSANIFGLVILIGITSNGLIILMLMTLPLFIFLNLPLFRLSVNQQISLNVFLIIKTHIYTLNRFDISFLTICEIKHYCDIYIHPEIHTLDVYKLPLNTTIMGDAQVGGLQLPDIPEYVELLLGQSWPISQVRLLRMHFQFLV